MSAPSTPTVASRARKALRAGQDPDGRNQRRSGSQPATPTILRSPRLYCVQTDAKQQEDVGFLSTAWTWAKSAQTSMKGHAVRGMNWVTDNPWTTFIMMFPASVLLGFVSTVALGVATACFFTAFSAAIFIGMMLVPFGFLVVASLIAVAVALGVNLTLLVPALVARFFWLGLHNEVLAFIKKLPLEVKALFNRTSGRGTDTTHSVNRRTNAPSNQAAWGGTASTAQ